MTIRILAASLAGFIFTLLSPSQKAESRIYYSFADIAEKAIPGVVNIRTKQHIKRDAMLDPYQFFLRGGLPKSSTSHSLGSGVIVDRNGFILTNYHVVEGAHSIEILFAQDKKRIQAQLVGMDEKTDLALLKISPQKAMKPLDFGDSDKLRVGDVVLAIGNPFGFAHTVTSGIISAKGRVIGTGPYDRFLQTDAMIHPGNSGGPLIDMRGRVIGINSAVSEKGPGIGFAIPSNLIRQVMRDLKKFGKVIRPWLGIVGRNVLSQDELDEQYDSSGVFGVLVENLIVEGPAYKNGIRIGDLIMGLDGKSVRDLNHLQRLLSEKSPHDQTLLKIYRRQKGFVRIRVPLAESPKANDLPDERDLF